MSKIKEYRCGDIVVYNGNVVKVISPMKFLGVNLSDGSEDVFIDDLEPIIVDDEVFLKLGFVLSDWTDTWKYDDGIVKIVYNLKNKTLTCSTTDKYGNKCTIKPFRYIHDLCKCLVFCDVENWIDLVSILENNSTQNN